MLSAEHLPNGLTLLQDDRFFKLGQDSVLLSAFAHIPKRARVLDLGCGTGALALLCWRDDLTITGLELQPGPADLFVQSIAQNKKRARVLDLGCGTGALALLCWRDDLTITGLELQPGPADLFVQSIAQNKLQNVRVVQGDLREIRRLLPHASMQYVVCNPPYFASNTGKHAANSAHKTARENMPQTAHTRPPDRTRAPILTTFWTQSHGFCPPAASAASYSVPNGCARCCPASLPAALRQNACASSTRPRSLPRPPSSCRPSAARVTA